MSHRGDNRDGKGFGDDERIRIDLDEVPQDTVGLYVVVNIYSDKKSFHFVRDSYVRLCVHD